MMLALDIGNSHVYAGLFDGDRLRAQFRMNSKGSATSDEIGLFLRSALRENGVEPASVTEIAVCTVVPDMLHSIRGACRKYFNAAPFVLEPGVRTGLQVKYRNPLEVGPDRIANAVAATHLFPGRDLLIIDFGTATTFCAVSRDREYLGGTILAGMRISMEALESRTARLPKVEILAPDQAIARSTVESIQSGLYYGTLGAVRELTARATRESFGDQRPWVIGTGGFSALFESTGVFDALVSDLVLKGLWLSYRMNH